MKNRCINWSGDHRFFGSRTRMSVVCLLLVCFALVGCVNESDLDLPGYGVFKPLIELEEDTKELSFESNDFEVELSANVDYEVEVTDVDWIVVNSQPEEKKCHFHIPQNESRKVRQAKIIFSSELFGVSDTLLILQGGDPNFIKVGEPIDLGLSVKWASWNVGAELPEDYGGYYAWGETEEKALYYWSNYKFYDENTEKFTKYSILYGGDNKTYLDLEDDVAHVKWGDEWRMPTVSEFKELVDNCTYEYVSVNGVYGYKMTGPNGNSIFLPNPPCRMYDVLEGPGYGAGCNYRSSTLETDSYGSAYSIHFGGNNTFRHGCERFMGVAVRPVYGPEKSRITISTGDVSSVSSDSVVCSGTVGGTDTEMECGIIYGPSTELGGMFDGTKVPTTSTGDFSVALKDLEPNSTYYYRAYVYIPNEHFRYEYGEIKSFTTTEKKDTVCTDENHIHAVDLGLSVKWACCNIDATVPEGFGGYYAWGETEEKEFYDGSTYKWQKDNLMTKYVTQESFGIVDNKILLDLEDDVAHIKLGGDWRMPTADEIDELLNKCSWQSVIINGVQGQKVTGPNGNYIFLPLAGYRSGSDVIAQNQGFYFSSTLYDARLYHAGSLHFNMLGTYRWNSATRSVGYSIRPVYGAKKTYVTVYTGTAYDISDTGALIRGTIYGTSESIDCGIVYGLSSDLSASNGSLVSTTSNKEFTLSIKGLNANTEYYYRAYVCVDGEYKYGEVFSFNTINTITVITDDAIDVTDNRAVLSGRVVGTENLLLGGIEYGTDPSLSSGTKFLNGEFSGSFQYVLTDLEPDTEYYYRACVSVYEEWRYGEIRSFKTKKIADHVDAVDLGLSVKWASCNVGAREPEYEGGFYSWGETEEKRNYSIGYYLYYNKDIGDNICGSEYDVAHVLWGDGWRMPTEEEFEELINSCSWQWTIISNYYKGYTVTGPNGNSIFLPAAGYYYNTDYWYWNMRGYYRTGSLGDNTNASNSSSGLYFDENEWRLSGLDRSGGMSVRPVYGELKPQIKVTTGAATDITYNSATLGGTLNNANVSIDCGIIYGTSSNLSATTGTSVATKSQNEFSLTINGLSSNTTYYYRAYAIVGGEYIYGKVLSFTTEQAESGVEAVDLGLSVKWAPYNVGATAPEEYGGYYAWGETEEKSDYTWATYKWCSGSEKTMTKYCTESSYGTVDNKTTLELEDDVAHVTWGNLWRMPTKEELDELYNECTWLWTTVNSINGYKVIGPNGNSIFLPVAGNFNDNKNDTRGVWGTYWTSSLDVALPSYSYEFYFRDSGKNKGNGFRFYGHSVRPVYGEVKPSISVTTGDATDITDNSVVLSGTVNNSTASLNCGFIYGAYSDLSATKGTLVTTKSQNEFSLTIKGLSSNTTYYYRAYAIVDGEYIYGKVLSFTTEQAESGVHAVDLGLSVKWASCNVGATAPEEYGGYYAWGETEEKSDYTWANYKWSINGRLAVTKYCTNSSYGTVDNKTTLDLEDDVAHVKWGGKWRMPTADEIDELFNECTWEYTMVNGVAGLKVTGPNGNSIFLPCAGYHTENEGLVSVNTVGRYWSSVNTTDNAVVATIVHFLQAEWLDNLGYYEFQRGFRAEGYSVRPVMDK